MSEFFVYLAAFIFLFIIYGFRFGDRTRYGHIPGPTPKWLIGSLFDFRKKGYLLTLVKKYGPMTKFFLGGRPNVLIGDPEIAKKVLQVFMDRDTFANMVTGPKERIEFERAIIPFTTGDLALRLRNSWMPAFHPSSLKNYEQIMIKHVNQLLQIVEQKITDGEIFDISKLFNFLTLDVTGSTAFGVNFDLLKGEIEENNFQNNGHDENTNEGLDPELIQQMLQALITTFSFGRDDVAKNKQKVKKSWSLPTPWFLFSLLIPELEGVWRFCQNILPSQRKVRMLQAYDVGRTVGEKLVKNARQKISLQQDQQTQERGVNQGCFLDAMIMSQDAEDSNHVTKLADYEIAAQAWSFITAGSNSANSLSFIIYLISSNPKAEQKIIQEIDSMPEFDLEKIKNLKFLDCVIKESNRMYPPIPLINRKTDANRMIDKFLIPKNTTLVVSNMAMHYDPKYWERPEDFYPERFLGEGDFPAYFPFGGGSRMCLGQQFALQEIKIALFMLYKKFYFRLTPGQVPLQTQQRISLQPLNGVKVTAHERN